MVVYQVNLNNLIFVKGSNVSTFRDLDTDTANFFKVLPGSDTLRMVIASKVILVEGPSDSLVIQRAYKDKTGKLPIQDGIDIIVTNGLTFKRFYEIAKAMNKEIAIVTDNDGNIKKLKGRYSELMSASNVVFSYEKNENLKTLEPSLLSVNSTKGIPKESFVQLIYKGTSKLSTFEEVKDFMINNKTTWASRVFDAEQTINYPEYIEDVINEYC